MFTVSAMALGARVRFYRERLGLTLEQLSDASEVDVGTISAIENRDSERSKFTGKLAAALGLRGSLFARQSLKGGEMKVFYRC